MDPTRRFSADRTYLCRGVMAPLFLLVSTGVAISAGPKEVPKDVIAVQIRKQGFPCQKPAKAERDASASKPDDSVWVLTCESATYKVRLVPKMAAQVVRLPQPADATAPTPTPPAPKAP